MESALDGKLFARERREVHVTALGEKVLVHARAMLAQLDQIRALTGTAQGLHAGRIRVATFPLVLATVLPPLLSTFQHHRAAQ